jgi:hypothetical protein
VQLLDVYDWLSQSSRCDAACAWADIIVVQRVLMDETIPYIQKWTSRGKAVVVDFDDAYDLIRMDNRAFSFWGEGKVDVSLTDGYKHQIILDKHPIQQFSEGLGHLTGIITPSRTLCNDWQRYIPAFYIPNYLDMPRYMRHKKRHNEHIVIGWGGSLSHVPSFSDSGVEDALGHLFSERDDIRFLSVGDKRITDRLPIPPNKLLYNNYVKANDWPKVLLRYDVGIAPLYDRYDCRRSHLKVMEYVAMGMPFVATRSSVYGDFFNAKSGLFVDQGKLDVCDKANAKGWYEALKQVVEQFDSFKEQAEIEKDTYRHIYDVDENVDNIIRVYEDILDARR